MLKQKIEDLFGLGDDSGDDGHVSGVQYGPSSRDGIVLPDVDVADSWSEMRNVADSVPVGNCYTLHEPAAAWKGLKEVDSTGGVTFTRSLLAKVVIPAGATVVVPKHDEQYKKIRVDQLHVEEIYEHVTNYKKMSGVSPVRGEMTYKVGNTYTEDALNEDPRITCERGLHVCAHRREALDWANH